jgi:hypothetical protein
MSTMERDPERADDQVPPAVGEPASGATGPGSRPLRSAGLRTLLLAACVAVLGLAAGSRAGPTVDQAAPEEPSLGSEVEHGCAIRLPPGHPPIGIMQGLPPGHPPLRAVPRLPPGHPPVRSMPPPAFLPPPVQPFTI